MSMYNLLEYNDNYSMTSGNVVNNYRDEVNDATNEDAAKYTAHNNKIRTSRSFEYKVKKMTGKTSAIATRLDTKVIVSLKYLSNFQRSLDLPLSNCEIELDLLWLKDCVISKVLRTPEVPTNPDANSPTDFFINTNI